MGAPRLHLEPPLPYLRPRRLPDPRVGLPDSLKARLRLWLRKHWYKARAPGQIHAECRDPKCLMICAMATKTGGFKVDNLGTPLQDSLRTHPRNPVLTQKPVKASKPKNG